MFGIKSFLKKIYRSYFVHSVTHSGKVQDLLLHFQADEGGHAANTGQSDLGYGWVHYGLIREQKPERVLCIGSRHGFIPAVLAQACKDNGLGHVDFVDAGYGEDDVGGWTGVGFWKSMEGKNIFQKFNLAQYISLHVMTTEEFFGVRRKKYGYVYIDGDHSLSGVVSDFSFVFPHTKKEGYIVFHDISEVGVKPEGEYGVWKLWKVLSQTFNVISITSHGSGLGIMQKK